MVDLFKKDLVKKGHSNPDIKPVPNGEVAFIKGDKKKTCPLPKKLFVSPKTFFLLTKSFGCQRKSFRS